jgi:hypothetical protein
MTEPADTEDDEFIRDVAAHTLEIFGRDGWDDPAMDLYNDLDPRRKS